jgi:hypothetical protein
MATTYTYDEKKVTIENGIVTYSDFQFCTVGQKPDLKALRACGWKKETTPTVYFSHGRTNSDRFTK